MYPLGIWVAGALPETRLWAPISLKDLPMYLAYYDESGDDGFPQCSSPLFVLSTLYFHYTAWKGLFHEVKAFRQSLASLCGFPVSMEMHTVNLLRGRNPHHQLGLSDATKLQIMERYCRFVGELDIEIVNVVIVKPRVTKSSYPVLDRALGYSIQRIENTLARQGKADDRFMILTDPGRVGKMRRTTRRMQVVNYIPSRFGNTARQMPISRLVEDPLPKDSRESHFIQLADVISTVVYLHALNHTRAGVCGKRIARLATPAEVAKWIDLLKPSLNLRACSYDPYGIVYHPRS